MGLMNRLKDAEPFNNLPDDIFEEIRQSAKLLEYQANTHIFHQDDEPTGYLYVIREGLVEITVTGPGEGEMVVDYRKEGHFFGGTPIFTAEPYTGGARTVRTTQCYLIPDDTLKQAARNYPQIGEYFTRIVLSRVRHLYSEIVSEHGTKALTQMEAYPFKKRLSEIMTTRVEWCRSDVPVQQVACQMTERNVSSILVLDNDNGPLGIITERDLVAKVIAPDNIDCKTVSAGEIMIPHPHTVGPDTYMYEAMAYMTGHRIKHLPVVDQGEVVGIVTMRDLMRYRSQKAMLLVGNIREETSLERLAEIRGEIVPVANTLLSETRSTPEVMEITSYIHHTIIRRVYDLCMEQMREEGYEPPDIRSCFLIMGSGGRREMLLEPDQDHGLIYENVSDERLKEVEAFFAPFSEKLVESLQKVGYPLCEGKVMANNPAWRGRLKDWNERLTDWVNEPEPQKVRYSSIFFDFVSLAGDTSLAEDLRDIVYHLLSDFPGFLYHMMSLDLRYRVPIGLFGGFIVEKSGEHKGELSLKKGGVVYIVDCIRMFSLEKELSELSTLDRLKALVECNVFAPETAEHIRAAFEALAFLRLRQEIELVGKGENPSHFLDPNALPKNEQDLLKESFHAVSRLQDATKRHFGRSPF